MKQIRRKSQMALKRRIVKSNRNMAKRVKGCVWCKDKSRKVRPVTKNIFKMIVLAAYKNVSSLKLQGPVSGDRLSVQEIEMVQENQVSFVGFTTVGGNGCEGFSDALLEGEPDIA